MGGVPGLPLGCIGLHTMSVRRGSRTRSVLARFHFGPVVGVDFQMAVDRNRDWRGFRISGPPRPPSTTQPNTCVP